MLRFGSKPQIFNENDWNDQIEQFNRTADQDINPALVYMLSKLQAEKGERLRPTRHLYRLKQPLKAAWSFYREHADQVGWDLTVLNPPWVCCLSGVMLLSRR